MNGTVPFENEILEEEISEEALLELYKGPLALAEYKFEIIKRQIEDFQSNLSDEYDVAIALASFGSGTVMQVTEIGFENPDILLFYGNIDGNEVQLIQHMNQLNFMLMATKKENEEKEPNRIGFKLGRKSKE